MAIEKCLILTSRGEPIAEGAMGAVAQDGKLSVKVLNDETERVAKHDIIQLVGMGESSIPRQCLVEQQEGKYVLVKILQDLDSKLRRNIRICTRFESFLYPLDDSWRGRRALTSVDISCGGLAFYAPDEFSAGDHVEVVIPVTSSPLLMKMELLSAESVKNGRAFYRAKFIDMHRDQEKMIREAVFSIQLENHARKTKKEMER